MVLSGNIDSLIDFFSFTAWIFYGGSMVALLVMRKTRPNHPRPYRCPLIILILVLAISAYLIVAPIIDKPQIEYLYAAAFIAAGMFFYLPFVKYGYVPKFMGNYFICYINIILTEYLMNYFSEHRGCQCFSSNAVGSGANRSCLRLNSSFWNIFSHNNKRNKEKKQNRLSSAESFHWGTRYLEVILYFLFIQKQIMSIIYEAKRN